MDPRDIANKVRKVIEMQKDDAIINKVYFNPLFASRLYTKVPELKNAKLFITVTETEEARGTIKSANIKSGLSGDKLKLGSVLLDGKEVRVSQRLVTVDRLVDWVASEAQPTADKTIKQQEEEKLGSGFPAIVE
jgi:hypothetical protein